MTPPPEAFGTAPHRGGSPGGEATLPFRLTHPCSVSPPQDSGKCSWELCGCRFQPGGPRPSHTRGHVERRKSLTRPLPPASSEATPASGKGPFPLPIRRPAAPAPPQTFPIPSVTPSTPVPSGLPNPPSRVPTPLPSGPRPAPLRSPSCSPQDSLSRASLHSQFSPPHSPFPSFHSSRPSFPSARRTLQAVGLRGKVSQ